MIFTLSKPFTQNYLHPPEHSFSAQDKKAKLDIAPSANCGVLSVAFCFAYGGTTDSYLLLG
jgi:hypothetical protein